MANDQLESGQRNPKNVGYICGTLWQSNVILERPPVVIFTAMTNLYLQMICQKATFDDTRG